MCLRLKFGIVFAIIQAGICANNFENIQDIARFIDNAVEKRFNEFVESQAKHIVEEKIKDIVQHQLSEMEDRINAIVEARLNDIVTKRLEEESLKWRAKHMQTIEDNISEANDEKMAIKANSSDLDQEGKSQNHELLSQQQTHGKYRKTASFFRLQPSGRRYLAGGAPYLGSIGFTSCVSVSDLVNLGDHHTILFDRAITNVGNAYHKNTGVFQAPVKGLYVFHLAAMSSPGKSQFLEFVKDGQSISSAYPDAHGSSDYENAGHHWVMELDQGSEVWIRTRGAGQIHGNCYTVFSGFLLNELE